MLKNNNKKGVKMTVCIGLLSENKKQAVAIADRMITDNYLSIGFEHGDAKIIRISKNAVAMCAGYTAIISEILDPIIEENLEKALPIKTLASKVAESYSEVRKQKINELYFKPRGLDIDKAYNSNINSQLLKTLDDIVDDFEFPSFEEPAGLEILIVGVDQDKKAHLYVVDDPGTFSCRDSIGWMCIGSGSPQAESSLILNKFNSSKNIKQALYFGYEAKKWAEKSPEVGRIETDIVKINQEVLFLDKENINELKRIYEDKEKKLKPIIDRFYSEINKLKL